jgi:hypothetical protein
MKGEINSRAFDVIMLMSNYPGKTRDWEKGWTMKQICDQNAAIALIQIMLSIAICFETEDFDNQEKKRYNAENFLSGSGLYCNSIRSGED